MVWVRKVQLFSLKFTAERHVGASWVVDVSALARRCKDAVHEVIVQGVHDVFEAEGIPEWPPLAELTIVQRRLLGFAEGPILRRTGELLESLTDTSSRYHIFEVKLSSTVAQIIVGTSLPKAFPLAYGDEETNLPARPMFPPPRLIHPELEGTINDAGHAI